MLMFSLFFTLYPKIFNDSSENEVEMDIDIDTTMETKPAIDREEKLRTNEGKLLSNRINERFTDYDGVMFDPNLTLTQKIIYFQRAISYATRRKIRYKENYFKNAFVNRRKFIKKLWRNKNYKMVGAIFTKIIQTCSGLQSN